MGKFYDMVLIGMPHAFNVCACVREALHFIPTATAAALCRSNFQRASRDIYGNISDFPPHIYKAI